MEKWVVVVLLLAAVELAPAEVIRRYVGVGGDLKVEPPETSGPITGVLWKYNVNLLAEWIKDPVDLTYYGGFKGRTTLDTSTGHLQVLNMSAEDAGEYSVEINSKLQDLRYDVKVIQEVPKPEVRFLEGGCDLDSFNFRDCKLTCDGITVGAEPVSYYWRKNNGGWVKSERDFYLSRFGMGFIKTFSCRMENPVSHKDSDPRVNLLIRDMRVFVIVCGLFLCLSMLCILSKPLNRNPTHAVCSWLTWLPAVLLLLPALVVPLFYLLLLLL